MNSILATRRVTNAILYSCLKREISNGLPKKCNTSSNRAQSLQPEADFNSYISMTSDILGISKKESKFVFSILQLKRKYFPDKMLKNRFFCEYILILDLLKQHFTSSQIINSTELLLQTYASLQQKFNTLHNYGFKNLKPIHIRYYSTFINFSESQLKEIYILDKDVDVFESIVSKYSLTHQEKEKIKQSLGESKASLPLNILQKKIFNIIQTEINKLPLPTNDKATAEELDEIPFLSQKAKDYLKEIKSFKKIKAHILIICHPILMKQVSPETLRDNLVFLLQHLKMTEDQLLAGPRAVSFSKSIIINRLDTLIGLFGNKILAHPNVLGFIAHATFNETIEKLKNVDIYKLEKAFPHLIRKKEKTMMIAAFIFHKISLHLNPDTPMTTVNQLKKKTTESLVEHPFCSAINYKNATQVLEYLLVDQKLHPNQVVNASCIVMYKLPSIKEAMNVIKNECYYKEWAEDPYVLQLALYFLEQRNFFKGELVFGNSQMKQNIR